MTFTEEALARLTELGLRLPTDPPPPAGAYLPYRLHNGMGFLAAQVSGSGPDALTGRVGAELSTRHGQQAARAAGLNALARLYQALDGFERLECLLHVAGHVASADTFWDQPMVLDGASLLFTDVLGERGGHTRTAFSHPRLPHNICVELEITFAYRD
ncbi:RidA family protein [Polymorphospora sp. NPDC051019]|uniref:RidA family protein n=1 Tax=Polymorphospora sp. NPDC051019 TaxID=3155725 RepID=UPI0034324939